MVAEQHIDLNLEEFASEVAFSLKHYQLLEADYDTRVSPIPDARTIRYYSTLGLLDRPRMEGRQARYGKRHLLQLLAIKALQGRGYPLAEIQTQLYGRADSELESLLVSLSQGKKETRETIRPVVWNEVLIEPGLKILVEDGWLPSASLDEIEAKVRAVLTALQGAPDRSNGGIDEHGN